MDPKYSTLKTIYEIVMNETNPLTYACLPGQIIIRQNQPWDLIVRQLKELAVEKLITIQQPGTTIFVTDTGIEKVQNELAWI